MFLINLTVLAAFSVLVVLPAYFAVFLQETIALKSGGYAATAVGVVVGIMAYFEYKIDFVSSKNSSASEPSK